MDAGQRAAEVEGKGQKERVRMFYTGWSASTGEADWALSPLFASQNWPPTLFNTAFYSNPQVDNALSEALKTTDPQQKTKLYRGAGYYLERVAVGAAGGRETGLRPQQEPHRFLYPAGYRL